MFGFYSLRFVLVVAEQYKIKLSSVDGTVFSWETRWF